MERKRDKRDKWDKGKKENATIDKGADDSDELAHALAGLAVCPRFLLILDLNGILLHRERKRHVWTTRPDAVVNNFAVWLRPHARSFMDFALANFVVGVWSSAREHNTSGLLEFVLGPRREELAFEENQALCTDTGEKDSANIHKPVFLKELSRLWKKYPRFGPTTTLLVDDTPRKARANPPHTAIHPPAWNPSMTDDFALRQGGYVYRFLETLALRAKDVPTFVATHKLLP